jgi:hypothetical protein
MKVLLVNGSPKKRFSSSGYFLGLLKLQLAGCETKRINLSGKKVYAEIFAHFKNIDALVIAMPLYFDAVPSHVLDFLIEAEKFCKEENCHFKLYVVSNCGFYEGRQCKNQLSIMRSFCAAAGLEWGGGLGIGGGEMLSAIRLFMIIFILAKWLITIPYLLYPGHLINWIKSYAWISPVISTGVNLLLFFAFSMGLFYSLFKMQKTIRRRKTTPDLYTGVTCCPRFLFTITACAYWVLRAAYHGTGFWKLYKKTGTEKT